MIIDFTHPQEGIVAKFTCTTSDLERAVEQTDFDWLQVLLGFNTALCGKDKVSTSFEYQSLDWKKGYDLGIEARRKAYGELMDRCLDNGEYTHDN